MVGRMFGGGCKVMKTFLMMALVLCILATRAMAQDVRYDFDKDKDFSKYKTYKCVAIKGAETPDGITAKQITSAISAMLSSKGLTETQEDSADLYIGYQTAIGSEKEFYSYSTGWGYGPGWGGGW